jgi:hypothetical protein
MRLRTMVMACLCGAALLARLANAAESSYLQRDPTLRLAQPAASPRMAETTTTREAASAEDLAKKLSNPIASLISVPFQSNFDCNAGQDHDQFKYTLNIQPVIPLSLSTDWYLITRITQPVIYQDELFPGLGSKFGLGDMTPSFFFSPKGPFHGWIWGQGRCSCCRPPPTTHSAPASAAPSGGPVDLWAPVQPPLVVRGRGGPARREPDLSAAVPGLQYQNGVWGDAAE